MALLVLGYDRIESGFGGRRVLPHPVISSASARSYYDGEFWHVGAGDCGDELGAVFRYPSFFGVSADHEATYVLQEDERDVPLGAKLDEMCAFEG